MRQRVKAFAWLLAHDKLLTNHGRWRRRLVDSHACSRCNGEREDALHMVGQGLQCIKRSLESFPPTTGGSQLLFLFFTRPVIGDNLGCKRRADGVSGWPEKFVIISWCLWRWRNAEIFEKNVMPMSLKLEFIEMCVWSGKLEAQQGAPTITPVCFLV